MRHRLAIGMMLMRHLIATPLLALLGCLLWFFSYVVLFFFALIFGGGVGGPLALPVGLIFIAVSVLFIGWGIFAPACAIAWLICHSRAWPKWCTLPITLLSAAVIGYAWRFFYQLSDSAQALAPVPMDLPGSLLAFVIPLVLYWTITEGPWALIDLFLCWWKNRR